MASQKTRSCSVVLKPSLPIADCRLRPLHTALGPLYLLSSLFGHKNCLHRGKYSLGLSLWIANMVIHFSLDFYEAYAIFGAAWASGVGMYLITFLTASTCLAKVTLPWLENGLMLLHEAGNYPETLRIMKIILRLAPVVVLCMGCTGGAAQYTCYYVDGATKLDFDNVLSKWLQIVLNCLRFTSLLHMFCGYSLFLVVPVCVMILSQLSMKEFKAQMDEELKKLNTDLSFGRAVTLFEDRANFIRQSSRACSTVLIILVMSSTLSFTLNVYNFLFVRRLAIYFSFAVIPLLWVAIPLMAAAWATETYQTFAGVVLKNWAQASRDMVEGEPREGLATTNTIPQGVTCATCRLTASSKKLWRQATGSQYARRKFLKRIGRSMRNVIRPLEMNTGQTQEAANPGGFNRQVLEQRTIQHGCPRGTREQIRNGQSVPGQVTLVAECERPNGPSWEETKNIKPRSQRFDFERYIIYLQCLLPDVGFSVGGFLVSWDKVFGLAVFMASLAAVFTQEVLFGSRKNTLGRP